MRELFSNVSAPPAKVLVIASAHSELPLTKPVTALFILEDNACTGCKSWGCGR